MRKILIILIGVVILIGASWWIWNRFDKGPETGEMPPQRKFIALGSSFSKANNLSSKLTRDNPEYSFSTGSKIDSLYLYLKKNNDNLIAVNLAESGANSRDVLQKQVPNTLDYHPKYVTLDPIADILAGGTLEEYKQNLSEIISKIKDEDTVIFISNYPDFIKMRSAPYQACKEDKLKIGVDKLNRDKIIAYNQVIRDVAMQQNINLVDIYGVLGPEDVSDYDCLHPNIFGQEKIANQFIKSLELIK